MIPIIITVLGIVLFIISLVFEIKPGIFGLTSALSLIILIFSGLPFLIFSILGIVYSKKSLKSNKKGKVYLILSIIDVFLAIASSFAFYYLVFVLGPSV